MHPKDVKNVIENKKETIKYVEVYYFEVFAELKKGNEIFVLDKQEADVRSVVGMSVMQLIEILKESEDDKTNRYYFFEIEKGTEK